MAGFFCSNRRKLTKEPVVFILGIQLSPLISSSHRLLDADPGHLILAAKRFNHFNTYVSKVSIFLPIDKKSNVPKFY